MKLDAYGPVAVEGEVPTGEHLLYGGEVRVRFEPDIHRYLVHDARFDMNWEPCPSVTQILAILDKSKALVPWAGRCSQNKFAELVRPGVAYTGEQLQAFGHQIRGAHKEALNRAGSIGTQAHAWIERYLEARAGRGAFPPPPTDPEVRSCCSAARRWIKEVDVRPFAVERILYSRKHGVVGTTDLAAALIINGRFAICDWKSSNRLYDTYNLQLAAYRAMFAEMTGTCLDDRWLIRLDKLDGSFEPKCLPTEEADRDGEAFFSLANTFRILQSAGYTARS